MLQEIGRKVTEDGTVEAGVDQWLIMTGEQSF